MYGVSNRQFKRKKNQQFFQKSPTSDLIMNLTSFKIYFNITFSFTPRSVKFALIVTFKETAR